MEIVLIRHGQPDWGSGVDIYTENPGLTDLGKLQSEKSSSVFEKNEIDELWISPLKRAQETFTPFEDKKIAIFNAIFSISKKLFPPDETIVMTILIFLIIL